MKRLKQASRLALVAGSLALGGGAVQAQDVETPSDLDEGQYPLLLDGTLSGDGDLKEDEAPHSGLFRFDSVLGPYEAFKANVREKTGINFGGSWGVLYQNYSDLSPFLGEPRDSSGRSSR